MYKKFLVPLDGSKLAEQVLPYARLLADAYDAVMTLLMVADPNTRPPFSMRQTVGDYLKYMAASLQPLSVKSVEKIGRPAEVIVDSAKEGADRLIAMATHGCNRSPALVHGQCRQQSSAIRRQSTFADPPGKGLPPASITLKQVIVPLDGSGLAEKVLPHVASLARKLKLEVLLVRAYELPLDAYVVANGMIDQGPAQFHRDCMRNAKDIWTAKLPGCVLTATTQ